VDTVYYFLYYLPSLCLQAEADEDIGGNTHISNISHDVVHGGVPAVIQVNLLISCLMLL